MVTIPFIAWIAKSYFRSSRILYFEKTSICVFMEQSRFRLDIVALLSYTIFAVCAWHHDPFQERWITLTAITTRDERLQQIDWLMMPCITSFFFGSKVHGKNNCSARSVKLHGHVNLPNRTLVMKCLMSWIIWISLSVFEKSARNN